MAYNTFKERQRHLREFAAFLQGDIGMDDITTAIARKFLLDSKAAQLESNPARTCAA